MGNLCSEKNVRDLVGNIVLATIDLSDASPYLMGGAGSLGLIPEISAVIEGQVGRAFTSTTETVYLSGNGTNILVIPTRYQPVIDITAITYPLSGELEETSYLLQPGGILRLKGVDLEVARTRHDFPRWPHGIGNVEVTLSHGYATVPAAVRGAAARLVAIEVLRQDSAERDGGLVSKSLGDRSESYGEGRHRQTMKDFAERAWQQLQPYLAR